MASYQDTVGSEQHSTADLQRPALQDHLVPSFVTCTGAKSCLSGKNGTEEQNSFMLGEKLDSLL